jgi:hypothetical protein
VPRVRVAVVGEAHLIEQCAPSGPEIERVGLDGGSAPPDVVLAFGGDTLPETGAPVLAWLPSGAPAQDGLPQHVRRLASPGSGAHAWRTMPLPVADALFASGSAPVGETGRALWLTPDGPRRRDYLERFDHSIQLVEQPEDAGVALNLHDGVEPCFEHRAARALAAGKLLVSETLEPSFGLEPGIDYLEARDWADLFVCAENAARLPGAYSSVRLRGRRKAEWFRASSVTARLLTDLRLERG